MYCNCNIKPFTLSDTKQYLLFFRVFQLMTHLDALKWRFVSFSSHLRMCFPQTIVHTYIHRQTRSHTKSLVQTGKAWKEQACLLNQENDILGHFPHPTWRKSMIHHTTTGAEPGLGSIICHTSPLPHSSVVFFFSVLACFLCFSPSQDGFCRLQKTPKTLTCKYLQTGIK